MDPKMWKLILILVIGICLILIVVQNTAPVEARFLWIRVEMPIVLLLLITAGGGFILGITVSLLIKNKKKSQTDI